MRIGYNMHRMALAILDYRMREIGKRSNSVDRRELTRIWHMRNRRIGARMRRRYVETTIADLYIEIRVPN